MINKPSVTICIPAYNEEYNLKGLLSSLLEQKNSSFLLSKILVASDGSTDNTIVSVKKINNKKILLIEGKEREGLAFRLNQLLSHVDSDIAVILNADVMILDKNYIEKLIEPIVQNEADMTSSSLMETKPRNFFEKTLYISMQMKKNMFTQFKNGNNIYTCRGPARAFTKKLYKKLRFPSSIGEDAYSYLFAVFNGFRFKAIKDIFIYYTLPSNYADHKKQSLRFLHSRSHFIAEFGEKFVNEEYKIPFNIIKKSLIKTCVKYPFSISLYLILLIIMGIKAYFEKKPNDNWESVVSSKLVTI